MSLYRRQQLPPSYYAKPPYISTGPQSDGRGPRIESVYPQYREGHFDNNGEFVADRRRNGMKRITARGEPNIGVVRVIMCDC